MNLTGFTDEASRDIEGQIRACKELGWSYLSVRSVDGVNVHELPEREFHRIADRLGEAGIRVAELGSLIGNWSKKITADFDVTLAEIDRAIPRMDRLGTRIVRIMSYAQEPWGSEQFEEERFRRLREIVRRFEDAGMIAAHENCMNWGGFSARHTLRLVENVPGLKLVLDIGNPVLQRDRSKPEPHPWQSSHEFWQEVREHVVHVHVKDCIAPAYEGGEAVFTMPGEGDASVVRILEELSESGYEGFIAIEPHVATVFHVKDQSLTDWEECYRSFVSYGMRVQSILDGLATSKLGRSSAGV